MRRLILLLIPLLIFAGYLKPTLVEKLNNLADNEEIYVIIHLEEEADLSNFPERAYDLKRQFLKDFAAQNQQPLIDYLNAQTSIRDLHQWWISNCFAVSIPKWLILDIVDRADIEFITDDYPRQLIPDYEPQILGQFNPGEDYISWNIEIINAHQVWELGYEGRGVVVGNMDTGVDADHPRLRDSYRGLSAWYDAINGDPAPYDDNSHGTGTMGFLVGNYGIGVLPKAKWIAVKIMDENGVGTEAQIRNGFDWVAGLPDSLRPTVMSNSWGHSSFAEDFWDDVNNWKSLGILPVFAIGNSGPNASTCEPPGRYPMALGVGATDPGDGILSYSSRGPTSSSAPYNDNSYWYRSDWDYHKPDIAAPADPTTTTAPDDQYQGFGGTSAASPHAAGVAGMLLSKDPDLTPTDLYNTITDYAALVDPHNYNYPNNTYGWGRLDAFKAIENITEPTSPNIFITGVQIINDDDGDNELDPGETANIELTIKNTGISIAGLSAKIWEENADIAVLTSVVSIGTINHGQEITISSHEVSATGALPEESYVYFGLRIYQPFGSYNEHDFFNIYVPMQPVTGGLTDTIFKDNGSPAYTLDESYWFAAQFVAAGPGQVERVINMTYNGPSTCSLGIWTDDAGQPGTRLYDEEYTAGANLTWQDYTLSTPVDITPGNFWVGYWMSNDPTQEVEDDDGAAAGNMISTDHGTTWSNSYWYDFMIRPVVTYTSITDPALAYGSYKIDDSEFGNNDGYLDPGERVKLSVGLKNYGVVCHNVTGTLNPGDANTTNWITFIDNSADFGTVQSGDEGGSNAEDPFIIQMFDESALSGWSPNFELALDGDYGANNSQSYVDAFNFTVSGPWMPWPEDTLWYALGTNDLWIYYDLQNTWYWATHAMFSTDSIWLDELSVYVYDNDGGQTIELPVKIWNVNAATGYPDQVIWSATAPATIRGWADVVVDQEIPGEFYVGYQNVWAAAGGGRYNYIIGWGDYFIGDITFMDEDNDWSTGPDVGYLSAPLGFYLRINEDRTSALSYYSPDGWTWPIIPSNSEQNDHVLDATLTSADSTWLTDFVCLNRSDVSTGAITGGFDNYLFLDNWGLGYTSVDELPGWNYSSGYTDKIYIPGGRHTLLTWLDWNDEVGANIFNYYLRTWGQQYVWATTIMPMRAPITADYAPDYTGLGAGPYHNVTAWHVDNWNDRWHGVGVRPLRFSTAGDSIDIDLRFYSDAPTDPNTGLTQVIEASCLGPDKIDFIVWNGKEVGTTFYPGVYSFGSANDSVFINFYPAYVRIDIPFTNIVSNYMSSTTPIHVYDLILYADEPNNEYSPNLTPAPGLDLGIGIYNSINDDHILRRSDALMWADASGAGGIENFTYINTSFAQDTFALVIWNNGGEGAYTLSGNGVVIAIEEEESPKSVIPTDFAFDMPRPNPFRKNSLLNFAIPRRIQVQIMLYDVTGRLVQSLLDKNMEPGYYQVTINTKNLASGIYFCQMVTDDFDKVHKLILTR
jgi:subtilisin family serine protease